MILHITHNDLDGVGCSILIKKCYDFVETFYLNYDAVDSFIQNNYHRYNQIIITDISPNEETFNFIENHLEIVFIDHHKTSLHLSDRYFAFIDTTKSATMLTYEWLTQSGFNLQSYKDLVDCINDFDMWHLKRDDSLK
ncbi:MAG: DHH family phosphoesterase, partial [Deferribacterales bacterium]